MQLTIAIIHNILTQFGSGLNLLLCVNVDSKLDFVNEQTDNGIVHNVDFRKTNGFTSKAFNQCSKIQILTFYFLRVAFADSMFMFIKMALICSPIIGEVLGNVKRLE